MKIKNENKSKFNLVDYIIKLNKECNFKSAIYAEKFFSNVVIKNDFEVKNKKKHCVQILRNFDNLFWNVNAVFKRGKNFTYIFISEYYLNNKKDLKCFLEKPESRINQLENVEIFRKLCFGFCDGLERFRYLYLIYYNNCNFHIRLSNDKKNEIFNFLIKKLSGRDIIDIFQIFRYTFNDSKKILHNTEMINKVKRISKNLNMIPEIKVFKNEITTNNEEILNSFLSNIGNYKIKFKDMEICEINDCVELRTIANFKIVDFKLKYKSSSFSVRIDQESLKIYAHVYKDKKRIFRDIIYRIEDFERIFLCIIDYVDFIDETYTPNIED